MVSLDSRPYSHNTQVLPHLQFLELYQCSFVHSKKQPNVLFSNYLQKHTFYLCLANFLYVRTDLETANILCMLDIRKCRIEKWRKVIATQYKHRGNFYIRSQCNTARNSYHISHILKVLGAWVAIVLLQD